MTDNMSFSKDGLRDNIVSWYFWSKAYLRQTGEYVDKNKQTKW